MSSEDDSDHCHREKFVSERFEKDESSISADSFMPALPPHLLKKTEKEDDNNVYGPVLPKHLRYCKFIKN